MGDKRTDTGDKSGKSTSGGVDWGNLWGKAKETGSKIGDKATELTHKAGQAIHEKADAMDGKKDGTVDTDKLKEKGKAAGTEGMKAVRGETGNKTVDQISDGVTSYIPGAGLLRKGAQIVKETGAERKVLGDGKGTIHAPSEGTIKKLGTQAVGDMIPVPGGGKIVNEVINKSGLKEKAVERVLDAAKSKPDASSETAKRAAEQKAAEARKAADPAQKHLPDVALTGLEKGTKDLVVRGAAAKAEEATGKVIPNQQAKKEVGEKAKEAAGDVADKAKETGGKALRWIRGLGKHDGDEQKDKPIKK